jgi:putative DNA primase/helicase
MWHIKNELKELVTGEWIRVNPKNVAAYRQRNHVNIIYLSNEDQPLPLDNDDRRHCVIWTPPELGAEFYDEVFIEQEHGGVEAFYYYLMHLDLGDFHPKKRPPMTDSKVALINLSMPSEDRFVRDWIAGDIILHNDTPLPFCACGSDELYLAYSRWCRKEGEMRPRAQNQFSSRMARRIGWEKGHRDRYSDYKFTGDKKRQRMITPSDADMAESIKRGGDDYRKKDEETVSQWATRCFFDFKTALGGDQ